MYLDTAEIVKLQHYHTDRILSKAVMAYWRNCIGESQYVIIIREWFVTTVLTVTTLIFGGFQNSENLTSDGKRQHSCYVLLSPYHW